MRVVYLTFLRFYEQYDICIILFNVGVVNFAYDPSATGCIIFKRVWSYRAVMSFEKYIAIIFERYSSKIHSMVDNQCK